MFARVVVFFSSLFLFGCTTISHTPLTQDASRQLQGKSVVRTTYPTADFAAFTAGKAAFALIGALAMIAEGNSIVKENDIQDPAIAIGQGLVDCMVSWRNATQIPSQAVATGDDIPTLLATYQGANILVDVKTLNWMFNYYPTDWAHYKVTYSARIRVIDYAGQKVVAETMCTTVQGDDANPPTKDQLLEDKAALLKHYLTKSATSCVDLVTRELLRIAAANSAAAGNKSKPAPGPDAGGSASGGEKSAADSGTPASGKTPSSRAPGRQLVGDELRSHFSTLGYVADTWRSGDGLLLDVRPDGAFWVRHSTPNSRGTSGSFSIRNDDDQVCLSVRRMDWKNMELCYELFDMGEGSYRMQSVSNSYYFNYVRN